jgi:pimeloyl-ACP methyl ester carboxylesterase
METFSKPSWTTEGISILNGAFGDYLHQRQNGLAIEMAFYHRARPLRLSGASLQDAYPQATAKLCILLHGLISNEGVWGFSDQDQPEQTVSYGSLLQAELGYTPLYLRYNTGLPIAENGAALNRLIAELVECYPVAIEDIIVIGHSMGGLLIRSACHYASEQNLDWVNKIRRIFYLGTPHEGSHLAKFAHRTAAVLHAVPTPVTRLIGNIINLRSQGVKDLRFGTALHPAEEARSQPAAQTDGPWLTHAQHYLLVGTLTKNPRNVISVMFGDALVHVPVQSDEAALAGPQKQIKVFPGVHHMALAHNQAVYAQIRRWCSVD